MSSNERSAPPSAVNLQLRVGAEPPRVPISVRRPPASVQFFPQLSPSASRSPSVKYYMFVLSISMTPFLFLLQSLKKQFSAK